MNLTSHPAHTARSLRRTPLFTLAVIVTLTVGIAAATTIFTVVNAVLIRPLAFGDPGRLVGVWLDMPPFAMHHAQQSPGTVRTFQLYAHSLEDIGLYQIGSANLLDPGSNGNPQRVGFMLSPYNTMTLFHVPPLLGRTFDSLEDKPNAPLVAVLSEGLWRSRYGGDRTILGRQILLNDRPTTVIGIMPASFRFPDAQASMWLPMRMDKHALDGGFGFGSVARLRRGVSIDAAQRDLAAALPRIVDVVPTISPHVPIRQVLDQVKPSPVLVPLRDDLVGSVSRTLWMVGAAAILLLLVTAANVANLMLVRADARRRELSVRAALGAGHGRILAQFFGEASMLAAVSVLAALLMATMGIAALRASSAQIPRIEEVRLDWSGAMFALIVGIAIAFVCGAIPAFRFMRSDVLGALRDGGRGGTVGAPRQRARGVLVAAQMAFALVALAASALLLRSFERLRAVQPGFDPHGVATVALGLPNSHYPTDAAVVAFYNRLTDEAQHLPGALSAAVTSHLPFDPRIGRNPLYVEGDEAAAKTIAPLAHYATVSPGYFATMRIPLIAGRTFSPMDAGRGDEAVISIDAARFYFRDSTGRSAIGKRVREAGPAAWRTVVGVVGGIRDSSLTEPPFRTAYMPEAVGGDTVIDHVYSGMALAVRTNGDVATMTRAMEKLVHDLDPTLSTFSAQSVESLADASMARLTFTMIVIAAAAAVTLIISIVGLYGVIAYMVTLRTREIGVRIALGAQPSSVAGLIAKQGMVLCATGLVAGLAIVAATTRLLHSLLFDTAAIDPLAIAAAAGILVAAALLASWLPARRAARIDPMTALRAE